MRLDLGQPPVQAPTLCPGPFAAAGLASDPVINAAPGLSAGAASAATASATAGLSVVAPSPLASHALAHVHAGRVGERRGDHHADGASLPAPASGARIWREVKIPVSAGLASSSRLAKLATDVAKPGFLEIKPGEEKDFLKNRSVRELSGIAKNRQRSLAALGAMTFGHVANLPSTLLKQKFGIWGQQLWLFANGRWNEPLMLEVKDRTTISSSTTLPYDEPDYEAALTFALSEATRMTGQLRREQLQLRELSLTIRFNDFSEVSGSHRFQHAQFQNSIINTTLEGIFRDIMTAQLRPVRQIRIAMWNLARLDTQPTLWGRTDAERWGALDDATHKLQEQLGKTPLMTGAQLALQKLDGVHKNPKAKCPFVPQREMVKKLWGTDADPLANKSDWDKRLAKVSKQGQFRH